MNSPTVSIQIFIAGCPSKAREVLRSYCFETGFCVSVQNVDFIYSGGLESGVRVDIINYPRFPESLESLKSRADLIARILLKELCQNSYTIQMPDETIFFSRKGTC